LGGDPLPGRHRALRTAGVGVMVAGACHGGPFRSLAWSWRGRRPHLLQRIELLNCSWPALWPERSARPCRRDAARARRDRVGRGARAGRTRTTTSPGCAGSKGRPAACNPWSRTTKPASCSATSARRRDGAR